MTEEIQSFFFEFIWKFEILFISLHQENKTSTFYFKSGRINIGQKKK